MKKVFCIWMCLWVSTLAFASNEKVISNISQLPANSKEFITEHFAEVGISHVIVEKGIFGIKSYEVLLINGIDIEFDKNGNWTEVDGNHTRIPNAIIPLKIQDYVKTNFAGNEIIVIEMKSYKYEVTLNNGFELTFNRQGNLIEIDN